MQTLTKTPLCHSSTSIRPSICSLWPTINLHLSVFLSLFLSNTTPPSFAFFPLLWTGKVWCGGTNYNSLFSLESKGLRLLVGCSKKAGESGISLVNECLVDVLLSIKAFGESTDQTAVQSRVLRLRFDYGSVLWFASMFDPLCAQSQEFIWPFSCWLILCLWL